MSNKKKQYKSTPALLPYNPFKAPQKNRNEDMVIRKDKKVIITIKKKV